MARPERNSVDYFPFMCEDGKKMFYIEQTYGNDGFAVFVKILRELAKTEYHYLNLSDSNTFLFLSAKCRVTKEVLTSIINDLVILGKFNEQLWKENKVVWCQDFIDSIQDAYKKRNNKCITFEGLLSLLISLGIRKPSKNPIKSPLKPQSIVKEIKEDKSIYRAFAHLSISVVDFEKLNQHYSKELIDDTLDAVENYKDNKKYTNLYLTAKKWLKKDVKRNDHQEKQMVY